nr:hypothetical protein CFP56_33690 [Quercus suber]
MTLARFQDLPAELIAQIVGHLPDEDARTIRLTSSYIERASMTYFGKHFFRKKGFMITSPSLKVLCNVASHRDLSRYVEHIWFNPDCFLFAPPDCAPEEIYDDGEEYDDEGNGIRYNVESLSSGDRARWTAYRCVLDDHRHLMLADHLEQQLTSALRGFPKLEVIGMRRSEDHRPWGWKTLKQAVGQDPRLLGPIPCGPMWMLSGATKLFLAIVNATAATQLPLRRLYTDAIEIDHIRPELLPQATLDRACARLLYLELNCSKAWLNARHKGEDYIPLHDTAQYGHGLQRLLLAAPRLRELGLQIFPDRKQRYMVAPAAADPRSWRRSYPYLCLARLAAAPPFRHLTRLKLEKLTAAPALLLALLRPCAGVLRSLKLRDLRLLADDAPTTAAADAPRPWAPIFAFLADAAACPGLAYVLLYHLMYEAGGVSFAAHPVPAPAVPDELFASYDYIAFEARGDPRAVRDKVAGLVEAHWYHRAIFSYAMDEELWHTDTSDEEG